MRRLALLALVAAGAVLLTFACSSSDDKTGSCADGDRQQCSCANGATGTATCASGAFGACTCGTTSSSGGTGDHEGGVATYDGGFGNYLGACGKNEDCPDGGTCFDFTSKGMLCTHTCTGEGQCEAPSPKCNPRGLCAIPDSVSSSTGGL